MATELNALTDEALMEQVAQHHHPAFAALARRHAERFYAVAWRSVFSKHEAEDIVQEAFLKLWRKPHLWNPRKNARFTTWFYRLVLNLCIDHNKKHKTLPLPEHFDMADPGVNVAEQYEQAREQQAIDIAIRSLPQRQQQALNLCFYEELSNKEAAEIMGVSLKTLQSLVMRAKAGLKQRLIAEDRHAA